MRKKNLSILLLAVILSLPCGYSFAQDRDKPVRVAVTDFICPESSEWLGRAIAESLIVKLGLVDNVSVVEREYIREVMQSVGNKKMRPTLIGAEYLIVGSVQLSGPANNATTGLKVSVRVISNETGQVENDTAFSRTGSVGDLFVLETDIARELISRIGGNASAEQYFYNEARTLRVEKLFAVGSIAYEKGRSLIGKNNEAAVIALNEAIAKLRMAQEENNGSFYTLAHYYEGKAREQLAHCQDSDEKAAVVRGETVRQFRRDAAVASHALFDLGSALQANGEYKEALESYAQYIKWMDESKRSLQWEAEDEFNGFFQTAPYPGGNEHAYFCTRRCCFTENMAVGQVHDAVIAVSLKDGKRLWTSKFKHNIMYLGGNDDRIFALAGKELTVFDGKNGEVLFVLNLNDLPYAAQSTIYYRHVFLFPKYMANGVLLVYREAMGNRFVHKIDVGLVAVDMATGKKLWSDKGFIFMPDKSENWPLKPQRVGESIFWNRPDNGKSFYECVDVRTRRDASVRFDKMFVECMKSNVFLDGGGESGWLVPWNGRNNGIKQDAPFFRVDGYEKTPVEIKGRIGFSRLHYDDIMDEQMLFPHGKFGGPFIVYDRVACCYRKVNWERFSSFHPYGGKLLGVYGDKVLWLSGTRKLLLAKFEPQPELLFVYNIPQVLLAAPVVYKNNIVMGVRSEKQCYNYPVRLFAVSSKSQMQSTYGESVTRYNMALCGRILGDKDLEERCLWQSVSADSGNYDAYRALIRLLLKENRGMAAWKVYCDMAQVIPEGSPRMQMLWRHISRHNGVVAELPSIQSRHGRRVLPDRDEVAVVRNKDHAFMVVNLRNPEKSWQDTGKVYSKVSHIIARDKNHVTLYDDNLVVGEGNVGSTVFTRYDLDTHEKKSVSPGSLEQVDMIHYLWSEPLRKDYDAVPQVFIDRKDKSQAVFFDVQSLREVARVKLPHAAVTFFSGNPADLNNYSNSFVMLYGDRYILGYLPYDRQPFFIFTCIDRKTFKILWTSKLPIRPRWKDTFFNRGTLSYFAARPVGDEIWVGTGITEVMESLSAKDGRLIGTRPRPVSPWYNSVWQNRADFHDVTKHLIKPKAPWRRLYRCQGGGMLPDGKTRCTLDINNYDVFLINKNYILSQKSPVREGPVVVGPYVVFNTCANSRNTHYVCLADKFFTGMGYPEPLPEYSGIELLDDRINKGVPLEPLGYGGWTKKMEDNSRDNCGVNVREVTGMSDYTSFVILSSSFSGAEVRYTLDGSIPVGLSAIYVKPVLIGKRERLRARSFKDGKAVGKEVVCYGAVSVKWPRVWTVVGPFGSNIAKPQPGELEKMPATFKYKGRDYAARKLAMNGDCLDFTNLYGGFGLKPADNPMRPPAYPRVGMRKDKPLMKQYAFAFAEIESEHGGRLFIGAGADYWMEWYLDGRSFFNTNSGGNSAYGGSESPFAVENQVFSIDLAPGKHVLCVRVDAGSGGWCVMMDNIAFRENIGKDMVTDK